MHTAFSIHLSFPLSSSITEDTLPFISSHNPGKIHPCRWISSMNNPHPLTQITFLGPSLRKLYGLKKICFPIAFLIYTALQITGLQIFTELNILSLINTSPNTLSLTVLQEDQGPGLHRLHLLSYNMANMHIVIPLTNMENTRIILIHTNNSKYTCVQNYI